jgi:hypothetical protein
MIERKPHSDKYRITGNGVTVEFLSLFLDDAEWPVAAKRFKDMFLDVNRRYEGQ